VLVEVVVPRGLDVVAPVVPVAPLVVLVVAPPVVAGDVPATSTVPLELVHAVMASPAATRDDQRGTRTTADARCRPLKSVRARS